ncbi:MAG: tetratricopeptide repeat protein [Nitrospirae bacterium]|nr:tetratricopeptide repeat protein [Nitrospirota bacterium]
MPHPARQKDNSVIGAAIRAIASGTKYRLLLIAVVGLISYSNTFHVPFQFDDYSNVADNPIIRNVREFFSSSHAFVYSPLKDYDYNPRRAIGYLTFAINYHFGGLNVTGYHIVNIAIHIINSILVYFIVVLTFRTPFLIEDSKGEEAASRSSLIALFSALIFVAHPVQTQAVTFIVQRLASLATMFYLLSVTAYIKARLMAEDKAQGGRNILFYAISVLSAMLAMKTKEIAFTLPFMVIIYEFAFFKSGMKKRLLFIVPILLTLLIIPMSVLGTNGPLSDTISDVSDKLSVQAHLSRWDYLMTEMRVITTYIRLIFLPVNQNLDYNYPIYHSLFQLPVLLSAFFIASLIALGGFLVAGKVPRAFRLAGFGILWFFITLSVESSIIPIADVIYEHRLYLPAAGAFIAITTSAFVVAEKLSARWNVFERVIVMAFSLVIVVLSGAAYARNIVWQDEVSLWEDVLRKSPGNARAHYNLGLFYQRRNMPDKAMEEWLTAVKIAPNNAAAHNNLGWYYQTQNMPGKALEEFLTVLKMKPDYPEAHNNAGVLYESLNKPDKAIEQYMIAIKLKPDYADAYNNLGCFYLARNMRDKAIEQYMIAVKLKPDYANPHYNLGFIYYKMGQMEKSRQELAAALKLNPYDEKTRQLLKAVSQ